eukprot:1031521-Alexandrium_andersonii.AAC.1
MVRHASTSEVLLKPSCEQLRPRPLEADSALNTSEPELELMGGPFNQPRLQASSLGMPLGHNPLSWVLRRGPRRQHSHTCSNRRPAVAGE